MKAFLSYSMSDADKFILTLLSSELRKKNFGILQSDNPDGQVSPLTKMNISRSQLFIGIITGNGSEWQIVKKEWSLAKSAKVPRILLVEDTVGMEHSLSFPHIAFNRRNPYPAISALEKKMEAMRKKTGDDANAWAWILGGAALLTIINLLKEN